MLREYIHSVLLHEAYEAQNLFEHPLFREMAVYLNKFKRELNDDLDNLYITGFHLHIIKDDRKLWYRVPALFADDEDGVVPWITIGIETNDINNYYFVYHPIKFKSSIVIKLTKDKFLRLFKIAKTHEEFYIMAKRTGEIL